MSEKHFVPRLQVLLSDVSFSFRLHRLGAHYLDHYCRNAKIASVAVFRHKRNISRLHLLKRRKRKRNVRKFKDTRGPNYMRGPWRIAETEGSIAQSLCAHGNARRGEREREKQSVDENHVRRTSSYLVYRDGNIDTYYKN